MSASDVQVLSRQVMARLTAQVMFTDAAIVSCYVSAGNEVDTHELIQEMLRQNKAVVLPRVVDQALEWHYLRNWADLRTGAFNVLEPMPDEPFAQSPNVIVAPGVAYTRDGWRLGQGGGYYDRYLAANPNVPVFGLCYGWQVVDDLPTEPHDRAVDVVVTESAVYS